MIKGFPKATRILEFSLNYSEIRHRLGEGQAPWEEKNKEVFGVPVLHVS